MRNPLTKVTLAALSVFTSISVNAAIEEGQLTIWVGGDKAYEGMAQIGQRFEEDTGIKVTVAFPEKLEEKFPKVAASGEGPDIIFFAHDRFGGYAEGGLLAEVKPSKEIEQGIVDFAWDAATYKGKKIAYPVAVESVSLIYNKALLPTPPKTWEEIPALNAKLQKSGKKAIMWPLRDGAYFTWPLLSADGGYAFKQVKDGYDINDVGVAKDGVQASLTFINNMIKNKVISADMNYSVSESEFAAGNVAMTINGPWGWANIDKAGIDYGVTTLPKFNGHASKPFVGVWVGGISSVSPNKELAVEFLENYLLTDQGLKSLNDDKPLGAVALKSFQKLVNSDARIAATMDNAMNGEVMPNVPQFTTFWYSMKDALDNVVDGRQSVTEALKTAEKRMTQ
ncbi:maltose/maltodextrin ABC transporter substrate-binding protein MalE [Vibrio sp. Of14-4]|uniref:maltose/maltodextrin ABC transporter substrate-binding protein MalE n=1 Tax=Vibrio sp. Of14-4 TaxID=2724878 RepID=UPI001EF3B03B|nr:maltose/maltodextrin ABC transporter substrate-binding protein MalE [Vibrio sp. Of14-4]MCG7489827.1 maltose/maltodextrin ABC transporter substrate-binding protein MalE [Vibrio sp. Of14-4]